MDIPKAIEFSIEHEVYAPAVNGGEPEKFGPDFAGLFRLRWPTRGDKQAIAGRFTAYWQAQGVIDPGGLQATEYIQAMAMATFEVLCDPNKKGPDGLSGTKPPWCSLDAPAIPKLDAAILRAYDIARGRMEGEKKSSDDAGSKPSPTS